MYLVREVAFEVREAPDYDTVYAFINISLRLIDRNDNRDLIILFKRHNINICGSNNRRTLRI